MAGISTIPVVETFLTLVNRDLPLESIYKKINQRLLKLLPIGHFTCLTLFRLDALNGTLSILNAGMPEVLLLRRTGELRGFLSSNLPAGIRISKGGITAQETWVAPGDRLLAVSDGMAEIFSREDLVQSFLATIPAALSKIPDCATCRLRPTKDPEWRHYSCAI
jgi:serine phosphatase RsbU (regulator of sigma subunit)